MFIVVRLESSILKQTGPPRPACPPLSLLLPLAVRVSFIHHSDITTSIWSSLPVSSAALPAVLLQSQCLHYSVVQIYSFVPEIHPRDLSAPSPAPLAICCSTRSRWPVREVPSPGSTPPPSASGPLGDDPTSYFQSPLGVADKLLVSNYQTLP